VFTVERRERQPRQRRRGAGFVVQDVRTAIEHDLRPGRTVSAGRNLVCHRAARYEERRPLAHDLRDPSFETLDRRIVSEHVVAHLGRRDDPPHRAAGRRDRVGAEVNRKCGGRRRARHAHSSSS
jgi:hypothetical protein